VNRYGTQSASTSVAGDREPFWEINCMELGLEIIDSPPPYTVLAVKGEVDVYSAPRLREKLVELVSQGHRHIVVDLEAVDFLDSTGLGVLVGGLKRLRSHEGDLTLVCTQARILKVFEITGLTTVFRIAGSVDEATSEG
jgi:anti-sigma B factor antagonist